MENETVIEIKNLSLSYESENTTYEALKNINLTINRGEFICIVGSGRKVDYIREAGVLVDDDPKNIRQWVKGGYEGYLVETKGAAVNF